MAGGFRFSSVTSCRWDNLPPCLGSRNLFVLAIHIQSAKRFSPVGQFDKSLGRFLVL